MEDAPVSLEGALRDASDEVTPSSDPLLSHIGHVNKKVNSFL